MLQNQLICGLENWQAADLTEMTSVGRDAERSAGVYSVFRFIDVSCFGFFQV